MLVWHEVSGRVALGCCLQKYLKVHQWLIVHGCFLPERCWDWRGAVSELESQLRESESCGCVTILRLDDCWVSSFWKVPRVHDRVGVWSEIPRLKLMVNIVCESDQVTATLYCGSFFAKGWNINKVNDFTSFARLLFRHSCRRWQCAYSSDTGPRIWG